MSVVMQAAEANLCRAVNVIDKVWRRMSDGFMQRLTDGRPLDSLPDLSEEHARRMSSEAVDLLQTVDAIDAGTLPHSWALTLRIARFQLAIEAQSLRRYWLAQHCGVMPAMFPTGAYGGGYLLNLVLKGFTGFGFERPADCERYLALLEDYAGLIGQMREKISNQARRGILIPQPALAGMRRTMAGQAAVAHARLRVGADRLNAIQRASEFAEQVARRVDTRVAPAYAALLDFIGDDYARRAPAGVGIGQFEGGAAVYESLVAEHLSMPMTIDAVHRAGHERMAQVQAQMAQLRESLGFVDREAFHRFLHEDPAWAPGSVAGVQAYFDAAIRRIEPKIDELFRFKPVARYRSARLDPSLEAGMTAGYYQPPMAGHPDGVYYFNGANAVKQTLASATSLIYHELIPGHHFHIASQKENELLHPLRQNLLFNAFNEGWAEYAATLAGEIGMYADPCERYGRLLKEAYFASRLVVDTGMNALGWPLEQARQYMREHTALSEAEIGSETLRYSTDIPGQSLAYKLGEIKMRELRERARGALGARFDLRDFHDVVLGAGGMPLEVLEWRVETWLSEARRS